MSHGNKECRKLLDDDETSKAIIGHTGLTTTRRLEATGHPTWEAQVYVIHLGRGS